MALLGVWVALKRRTAGACKSPERLSAFPGLERWARPETHFAGWMRRFGLVSRVRALSADPQDRLPITWLRGFSRPNHVRSSEVPDAAVVMFPAGLRDAPRRAHPDRNLRHRAHVPDNQHARRWHSATSSNCRWFGRFIGARRSIFQIAVRGFHPLNDRSIAYVRAALKRRETTRRRHFLRPPLTE
jgi:hypothetical protein